MSATKYEGIIASLAQMQQLGQGLAALLKPTDTLLLEGTLGAGKTTLAQAIIGALNGGTEDVTSPTFSIMQSYNVAFNGVADECWHMDLYRIRSPLELDEIGVYDLMTQKLCIIEWPDRLGHTLPESRMHVEITPQFGEARHVRFTLHGALRREELLMFLKASL